MKRFILNSTFLLLFFCNIAAHENNFKSQSQSFYTAYFWMKEFIVFFSYHHFFMNHDLIDNVFIRCENCQHPISFYQTFGHFSAKGDEAIIMKLKHLAYQGTVEELSQFLEKTYNNYQIICYQCDGQYHSWKAVS